MNDPTSYGSDIIRTKEERALGDDDDDFYMPGDEDVGQNKQSATSAASWKPKEKSKQRNTLTILTEDREWGDRGKG